MKVLSEDVGRLYGFCMVEIPSILFIRLGDCPSRKELPHNSLRRVAYEGDSL